MLITFKSKASADVIMFGEPAQRLIELLGKDASSHAKGIVTVDQLPGAIARLQAAIAEDKAQQQAAREAEAQADVEADPEQRGMAAPVGLAQRAWPLLDMLQTAQREGVPVVWGV
ncbi:MAG: DUF1840 domain-containing protein [Rhodocyclales bacterium]|nr:DUF1840 domain-containing protein [Rhodocyclales bacterium]